MPHQQATRFQDDVTPKALPASKTAAHRANRRKVGDDFGAGRCRGRDIGNAEQDDIVIMPLSLNTFPLLSGRWSLSIAIPATTATFFNKFQAPRLAWLS